MRDGGRVVTIGEGKKPVSILDNKFYEELCHPHLFPTGQYGYKVEREIPLAPSKYFNERLLHYTQRFASDNDYIFFAHTVLQKVQLSSQIDMAMKKVLSNDLTEGILSKNFKQVLAMVRQFETPTFFLTLSCADLGWNDPISIIFKLNRVDILDEEVDEMSYHERFDTLNKDPVLVARHFQYRVEVFFKIIVLDGPLGKTHYYVIGVEFQVRRSPHIHSFIWF